MKLTKFDYIQIVLNTSLILGVVLNILYIVGVVPRWLTTVSLVLAILACGCTNVFAKGDNPAQRAEVHGMEWLAGLTYITGAAWVLTYGASLFLGTKW